jgi:hypothetical protein
MFLPIPISPNPLAPMRRVGAFEMNIRQGITVAVLGLQDLLLNKLSTGREKDAADIPLIKRLLG